MRPRPLPPDGRWSTSTWRVRQTCDIPQQAGLKPVPSRPQVRQGRRERAGRGGMGALAGHPKGGGGGSVRPSSILSPLYEPKVLTLFPSFLLVVRSLKGAPSALLIHADPSLAPRPPSPADPFSLNPLLPATRTDPIVLPLCVNWTSKQTFQGPRVFSEVESMVRSMKAAQTSRLAAESESLEVPDTWFLSVLLTLPPFFLSSHLPPSQRFMIPTCERLANVYRPARRPTTTVSVGGRS